MPKWRLKATNIGIFYSIRSLTEYSLNICLIFYKCLKREEKLFLGMYLFCLCLCVCVDSDIYDNPRKYLKKLQLNNKYWLKYFIQILWIFNPKFSSLKHHNLISFFVFEIILFNYIFLIKLKLGPKGCGDNKYVRRAKLPNI